MRIWWGGALLFLTVSFVWGNMGYADLCDDVFERADALWKEGNKAMSQADYVRARELFTQSRDYFLSASRMKNCRCPKVEGSAASNAQRASEIIIGCEKMLAASASYEAERLIFEEYNKANEKYTEGHSLARNEKWDEAIAAFEEAALNWEKIAATSQSENAEKAAASAQLAHSAADRARKFKQKVQ